MDNKTMTIKKYRTDTPRSLIVSDPAQLTKKLTKMIVNGRNYNEAEASALAEYAIATGLDPFIGECYFIPGSGAGPGVQGWYRKSAEQLEYECQKTKYPVAAFWFEYEQLTGDDADFDSEKGDIGYRTILYDDVTKRDWEERILGASIKLMVEAKVDNKTSMEMAREIVGKCPHWEGIGVVHSEENFAAPGKPEKYDRHERAMKRGAKITLKKRFSRLYLPEPADWDPAYILNGHAVDVIEDEPPHEQHSEAQILKDLGYEPETEPVKSNGHNRPYSPAQLKARIQEAATAYTEHDNKPKAIDRNMIAANLELCFPGETSSELMRHALLKWLTGKASVKDLTNGEVLAIKRWLNVIQDSGDAWIIDPIAVNEASAAYNEAVKEQGQQELGL